jgi:hypothetical protein
MTFSRANGAGWGANAKLTSAQANAIDINQANAIDGAAGGTYAPSGALTLGGSGVLLSGGNHAVTSGGTLTFNSGSTCAVVSGGTLLVQSGGTVTLSGTCTLGGTMTVSGTLTMAGLARVSLASRSLTRWVSPSGTTSPSWLFQGTYSLSLVNTAAPLYMAIDNVPNNATLTSVIVSFSGSLSSSTMPTTMPTVQVWRVKCSDGTQVQLGTTTTDNSVSSAVFTAVHQLTVASINSVIDRANYRYFVIVTPGTGGSTISGSAVYGAATVFTVTELDDGAG